MTLSADTLRIIDPDPSRPPPTPRGDEIARAVYLLEGWCIAYAHLPELRPIAAAIQAAIYRSGFQPVANEALSASPAPGRSRHVGRPGRQE
jgi:hypothetical protein